MEIFSLDRFIQYSRESHVKRVFFDSKKIKAQVMGLKQEQQIPPCRMDNDVVFFIMDGEGKIIVDDEEKEVKKLSWVFVPKEAGIRSLVAESEMAVLAMQIKE